jgi:hypothetical protein
MAIVEHKPEKGDPKPLILGISLLLLIVLGVGIVLWSMLKPNKPKTIKLPEELAKKQTDTAPGPVPQGPPFPAPAALEQVSDPGATMINLDLKGANVAEALAALEKQSGVKLASNLGNPGGLAAMFSGQKVDVSIKNQPYWVAFRQLLQQANLTTYMDYQNRNEIKIQQGQMEAMKNPTVVVGSSLLVLKNVVSHFHADLVAPRPASRELHVYLTAFVEPKVNAFRIMPKGRIETAVDENGVSLIRKPDPWDERNSNNNQGNWQAQVDCHLNYPPNAGQKIAKLKGYVSVITIGSPETLKVKDPMNLKNADQKVGNTLVRVRYLRKQGSQYELSIQVPANSPLFGDWDDYQKPFKLLDANGKAFTHGGSWGGGGSQTAMDFGLYFNAPSGGSAPAELQVTLPAQVKELRVPFEFTDLPLPH